MQTNESHDNRGTAVLTAGLGVILATTVTAGAQLALAGESPTTEPGTQNLPLITASTAQTTTVEENVQTDAVIGTFSFTQESVTPVAQIRRAMGTAPLALCSSTAVSDGADTQAVAPEDWYVEVGGDVEESFVASLDELNEAGPAQLKMGCTCAGNPADGRASINAEVSGATLASIIQRAQPADDANTVVFTSSDGYAVALPLFYVRQHFTILVYQVNGEPIANSMGGTNQLWVGSTAANYYVRDVVSITFESRETPPATPGTAEAGDEYENCPNIGVLEGGKAA